ncbi:MAG: FkbM family methyltransferase [Gammaproteobacteria bacterium]|nr:FkbM family methyltransferase [Gammaproteobacteria bacterium]
MSTEIKKRIIIYGFGVAGKKAYNEFKKKFEIIAFVDGLCEIDAEFNGIPVFSPDVIPTLNYEIIFIASMYIDEIKNNLLKLGVNSDKVKLYKTGLSKFISSGDIAIQVGVNMYHNDSQLLNMAELVGKDGTVIGIEPDFNSIKYLQEYLDKKNFACKIIIVNKGTFSQKDTKEMYVASDGNNQLYSTYGTPSLASYKTWTRRKITVQVDTIDNILSELKIEPEKISHINMTINGCEYESLKGMTNILEKNKNLSLTVIAGRENEKGDIGFINGKPDHIVISDYLLDFGFKNTFSRFSPNSYGYVTAVKGNKDQEWLEWGDNNG